MIKKILKISLYAILSAVIILSVFLIGTYLQVRKDAENRIERGVIDSVIFSESPVYYDDGITPIGVFFDKIHSKYIQYNDIPKSYIKALIASEDGDFFNHPGFDIKSIIRALIANLKAGKVVQGGSTITQQTALNIFKREKRTYMSELKEIFQALLLEKRYTKEEILEMYANQYFVTGFGKGLVIAAKYFFDKDVKDLDLVESAFIAGMVKGPNKYNPFTKKDENEKNKALSAAKIRKDYVLKNMRKHQFITEDQYHTARDREVPFKEGKVTYQLNVIMDYIREQLESDYFRDILHKQGIDNIATSGIKIYTSISKEIQKGALESIRNHLPYLDAIISGYNQELHPERYISQMGALSTSTKSDLPFFSTVESINKEIGNPSLTVAWDNGTGNIDYEGFKDLGEAWLKWKKGSWAVFEKRNASDFLDIFNKGDLVPVRFIQNSESGDLEKLVLSGIPELEGGIVVLKNGMVKAMVGGFFNRHFNRASDGKRQLGSIFKPLVYTAALQLKWNNLDELTNMPDIFAFENTFYIPRPDHEPESDKVSMTWAGAKSENLATIWLLYHLTDRLNMSEFRQVVERIGLAREESESYNSYVKRIRDKHGVVVNQGALMEAAFEEAKKGVESDLIFSGNEESLDNLSRLHFNIDNEKLDLDEATDLDISRLNFTRLRSINIKMKESFNKITQLIDIYRDNNIAPDYKTYLKYFYHMDGPGNDERIIYSQDLDKALSGSIKQVTPEWILNRADSISPGDIWIDNVITSEVIDMVQSYINRRYKELLNLKRYDFEVLYTVRDFKTLVNLLYIKDLATMMGISTHLDPVLSFPLGSNSISIIEAALTFNTMMSGSIYPLNGQKSQSMAPIIKKIVDREGETIWEYAPEPVNMLSNRVAGSVKEILRMVVENGTGQRAKDAIILSVDFENGGLDLPVPAFGKTGTANRFTNSSFAGFIPGLNETNGQFDTGEGYVIVSYVGYDDNRPMKGPYMSISGASGALRLWVDTSNAIVNSPEYKSGIHIADLVFFTKPELHPDDTLRPVNVSSLSGLPQSETEGEGSSDDFYVYSDMELDGDELRSGRDFEPIQGVYDDSKN